MNVRAGSENRDAIIADLQNAGIDASPSRANDISYSITQRGFEEHSALMRDVLGRIESASRA